MSVFFHLRGSIGVSWTSTGVRDLNDNPPLWLRILTWSQDFGFTASVMVAIGNVAAAKKKSIFNFLSFLSAISGFFLQTFLSQQCVSYHTKNLNLRPVSLIR